MSSRLDEILGGGGDLAADPVLPANARQTIRQIVIDSIENNGLFATSEHVAAVREHIGVIDRQSELVIFQTIAEQF